MDETSKGKQQTEDENNGGIVGWVKENRQLRFAYVE